MMRRSLLSMPLHPAAFGLFPVLALLVHNVSEVTYSDALRPLAEALAISPVARG